MRFWLGLLAVVVAGVLVVGRPPSDGPPLHPSSTGPLGTRALVLLLEELGAEVDVTASPPGPGHDVALVLADDLDPAGRATVERWTEAGGTLVVADPSSALNPVPVRRDPFGGAAAVVEGPCPIPALAAVERIDVEGALAYATVPGSTGCFGRQGRWFLVVLPRGRGQVVALGGAGPLVNAELGSEDNAVLAASLLAPAPGARVALLQPAPPGSGSEELTDLVGDGVKGALVQLALAFLLYALWRARRLGSPVPEPLPVELDASRLVAAVGHLLHQGRRRDRAASLLADDLRRSLATRLGLPADAPADRVAEHAAARAHLPLEQVRGALRPDVPASDDDLVALAAAHDAVRQEVLDAR